MNTLVSTDHGAIRMAQRGFNMKDAELISMVGTEVDDGYLVRHADYQELERALKSFLERIRRIRGKRLVVATGRIVTAYHASRRHQRRLLRSSRAGNLYE
jgi:hypothetical protein